MSEDLFKYYCKLIIENCEGCKENWLSQKDHRCCFEPSFFKDIWQLASKKFDKNIDRKKFISGNNNN